MSRNTTACTVMRAVSLFNAHRSHRAGSSSKCRKARKPLYRYSGNRSHRSPHRLGTWICASSGDTSNANDTSTAHLTPTSLKAKITTLEASMAAAVEAEDFQQAAKFRDELNELQASDPLYVATRALQLAIAEERYDDAAVYRDQVTNLTPKRPSNISDEVTDGVRVQVISRYVKERSEISKNEFLFSYRVTITNESSTVVQLINRAWSIEDDNGSIETVEGPGVIGQQPVLLPGQTFEYQSACPLPTPFGIMKGTYGFVKLITQTVDEYNDDNAEGLETPDEVLNIDGLKGSKGDIGDNSNSGNDSGNDDTSSGVTFLKQPKDSEFEVKVGAFGLNAEE